MSLIPSIPSPMRRHVGDRRVHAPWRILRNTCNVNSYTFLLMQLPQGRPPKHEPLRRSLVSDVQTCRKTHKNEFVVHVQTSEKILEVDAKFVCAKQRSAEIVRWASKRQRSGDMWICCCPIQTSAAHMRKRAGHENAWWTCVINPPCKSSVWVPASMCKCFGV